MNTKMSDLEILMHNEFYKGYRFAHRLPSYKELMRRDKSLSNGDFYIYEVATKKSHKFYKVTKVMEGYLFWEVKA